MKSLIPKRQAKPVDMASSRLLPNILKFSIPLMFTGMLQLLFNTADIIIVGRFAGDEALAAVGSNASLISLFTNIFIGLSVGTNVLIARLRGAEDSARLQKTVHTSILLSILSGFLLIIIGFLSISYVLDLMQVPTKIFPLSKTYLLVYFLGMPALMLYNFGSAILRATGDTKRPLYFLLVGAILNALLDLLFVAVFHWDVAGAALATALSFYVAAFLIIRSLTKEQGDIHLDLRKLAIDTFSLLQILRIGIPSGMQGIFFALSNVIIQSAVNGFGEIIIAGNAASNNIENFMYIALNSFCQAATVFTSFSFGARRFDRITPILLRCSISCVIFGSACGGLALYFGPNLLSIYSSSDAVIAAGMVRAQILFLPYFLCGFMDILVGSIRGMGYSLLPMFVSLCGACVLRITWVMTIFQIPQFHFIETIYWSYPISWILTAIIHIICYIFILRKIKKSANTLPF